MVKTVVVDTSVLIEYARTGKGIWVALIDRAADGELRLVIPTVVVYEFWAGKSLDDYDLGRAAEEFFDELEVVDFTLEMAKIAGELTRHSVVKGLDAMIAATGLVMGDAEVATLNRRHFEQVSGLLLWDGE